MRSGAPAVSLEQAGDPFTGKVDLALRVHNPTANALPVQASLLIERDLMPEAKQSELLQVEAGQDHQKSDQYFTDRSHSSSFHKMLFHFYDN